MKRIIVCCDGTWNKPDNFLNGVKIKTNVQKIYEGIDDKLDRNANGERKQVKFYGAGVGTGFGFKDQLLGGAFGSGIDKNIQDAYKFLMWNYEMDDQIFLFGFSRGAYTVRSLAGLIRNCGVMKPDYLHLVNEAYSLYRDRTPLTHPDSDLMKAFKNCYAIENETNVYFIGVWDTVGALGVPSSFHSLNKKYQFHDVKLSSTIKYAYQALSIDEKRKVFEPTLWEVNQQNNDQFCEQVWFPGAHSDVGGGYPETGLSNISLMWMLEKASNAGLAFQQNFISTIVTNSSEELHKASAAWYLFTKRKLREINRGYIITPNEESGRLEKKDAITNESVHYTSFERCFKVKKYRPVNFVKAVEKNVPYDPIKDKWNQEWLEFLSHFQDMLKNKKHSLKDLKPLRERLSNFLKYK